MSRPVKNTVLWAVSRSRSSAFERAIMQRCDTEVFHELLSEPFLRDHHPAKFAKIASVREQLKNSDPAPTYRDALALLTGAPQTDGITMRFSKEVAYFCDFDLITSETMTQLRHVFLVRSPLAVMKSLYRVGQAGYTAYFDPVEAGFIELSRVYALACEVCVRDDILVLDSDVDLMQDPESCLRRFCAFCEIPFDPAMLSWSAGSVPSWQFFKGWHDDAERSTGFEDLKHEDVDFPSVVYDVAQAAEPIYEAFKWRASLTRHAELRSEWLCLRDSDTAHANLIVVLPPRPEADGHVLEIAASLSSDIDVWTCESPSLPPPDHELYDRPLFLLADQERVIEAVPGRLIPRAFRIGPAGDPAAERNSGMAHTWLPAGASNGAAAAIVGAHIRQDLSLLNAQARRAATEIWEEKARQPPPPDFVSAFLDLASIEDRVVLTDGTSDYTGRELVDAASAMGERIRAAAMLAPGYAALRMERSAETVVAMSACLLAGVPFVEIPGWYTPAQESTIVSDLEAVVLVCDRADRLSDYKGRRLLISRDRGRRADSDPRPIPQTRSADETAYGILTSGTTGVAKIVKVPRRALLDSLHLWRGRIQTGDRLGINAWLPGYIFYAMVSGATSVVIPDSVIVNPAGLSDFASKVGLTQMMITPTICEGLSDRRDFAQAFASLRRLWLSGERVPEHLVGRVREALPAVEIIDLYGSNEAGDVAIKLPGSPLGPVASIQVLVVDRSGEPVCVGCVGEIVVSGPGLFTGYHGEPRPRGDLFVANPIRLCGASAGPSLFRMGDHARQMPHGSLELVSRSTSQTKIRGFKVVLERVAQILEMHPRVRRAIVEAEGDGPNRRLSAWVLPEDPAGVPISCDLRDHARHHLPYYAVPSAFFEMTAVISGPSQKAASLTSGTVARVPLPSRSHGLSDTEAEVASVWRDVLGPDAPAFRSADDLIELGGSLLIARVVQSLEQRFRVKVSFEDVFQNTTLAGISKLVDALRSGEAVRRGKTDIDGEIREHRVTAGWVTSDRPPDRPSLTYFLTGATGYLGNYLLRSLLARSQTERVITLMRGNRERTARERLRGQLGERNASEALKKVEICEGGLQCPSFGLDRERLDEIIARVDCVVHAGADVNWIKPYSALRDVNVGGAATAVALACRANASFVLVSTLAEDRPSTGYNESKLVAEGVVRAAHADLGMPYSILRCGDLAAPMQPLAGLPFNPNDYFVAMLGACLELGCWPADVDWSVNLAPVDLVADVVAGVAAGKLAHVRNRTVDVVHPVADTSWNGSCEIIQSIVSEGCFRGVEFRSWRRALLAVASQGGFTQRAALLLDLSVSDFESPTDRTNALGPADAPFPALGHDWCNSLVTAILNSPSFVRKDLSVGPSVPR